MILFFLTLAAGTLVILLVALAFAWQKERERAIRAELVSMHMPSDASERFRRVELALEGIAVEVERLAEAQRFNSRLLVDKNPQQLPPPPEASTRD